MMCDKLIIAGIWVISGVLAAPMAIAYRVTTIEDPEGQYRNILPQREALGTAHVVLPGGTACSAVSDAPLHRILPQYQKGVHNLELQNSRYCSILKKKNGQAFDFGSL